MLTAEEIEKAKARTRYSLPEDPHHEHDDCIRIAYEWLDAQKKLSAPNTRTTWAMKHLIEHWGGRYVSTTDVDVAAELHPEIEGKYPHFNISSRLTLPSDRRLASIGEAFAHEQYRDSLKQDLRHYPIREDDL